MVKVRLTRRERAMKFGRYFMLRIASSMRLRVCSGIEREAAELFQTAETVPGVRPKCSATAFNVTRLVWGRLCLLLLSIVGRDVRRTPRRVSASTFQYVYL